jgi:hypothetical protein
MRDLLLAFADTALSHCETIPFMLVHDPLSPQMACHEMPWVSRNSTVDDSDPIVLAYTYRTMFFDCL